MKVIINVCGLIVQLDHTQLSLFYTKQTESERLNGMLVGTELVKDKFRTKGSNLVISKYLHIFFLSQGHYA